MQALPQAMTAMGAGGRQGLAVEPEEGTSGAAHVLFRCHSASMLPRSTALRELPAGNADTAVSCSCCEPLTVAQA